MQLLIYGNKIKTSSNKSETKCGLLFRSMLCIKMKEHWNREIQTFLSPLNEIDDEINPNIKKQLIYPRNVDIVGGIKKK